MIYITLFYEFFKIGLFAIGGGLATLPFLYDLCGRYSWITTDNIADMVAISQSTPGPLGINMATYAGYQGGGLLGGIIATIWLITPSIIIIIIIIGTRSRACPSTGKPGNESSRPSRRPSAP